MKRAFWFALAALVPSIAATQTAGDARQVPLYVVVEPADPTIAPPVNPTAELTTGPGLPLKIRGVAALQLAGKTVSITITGKAKAPDGEAPSESKCPHDQTELVAAGSAPGPPVTLSAAITKGGTFETRYTPKAEGEYDVVVALESYRGETHFEVDRPDADDGCDDLPKSEIEKEAEELSKNACAIEQIVRTRVDELPASPAKDELKTKLDQFDQEMKKQPGCGAPPLWLPAIDLVSQMHRASPWTYRATTRMVIGFQRWLDTARKANKKAPEITSQLTQGNVVCDQLDIVTNGLKFCDFYMGLLTEAWTFPRDFLKEYTMPKLIGMAPVMKRTPAMQQGLETSYHGMVNLVGKEQGDFNWGRVKMGFALAAFASSRVFDRYCQQFQGPISGSMNAEFYDHGLAWWKYKIEIQGQIILRYPKNASGNNIALTGEIIGNAMTFKSWDHAIQVLFPKLAMGTVFKEIRLEPLSMNALKVLSNPLAGQKILGMEVPDINPVTTTIDSGGLIARNILTPAFFRVPIRGDLTEKTIRLELKEAATDFDDARVKVIQIMLPVTSLWPTVNDYALPYKGARFMMFRAMNDAPVELELKRADKSMSVERQFHRERKTADNKGVYDLSLKACNPGC